MVRFLVLLAVAACGRLGFGDTASDAAPDLGRNLVAWYRFEDPIADGTLVDSVAGNNGVCIPNISCAATVNGRLGNGGHFTGAQCYATPAGLPLSATQFTAALWMKLDSNQAHQIFATQRYAAVHNTWGLYVEVDGTAGFESVTGVPKAEFLGADLIPTGVWIHFAITYDGTTKKIWLNGINVAMAAAVIARDTSGIWIGCDQDDDGRGKFGYSLAIIDEVRVYDRLLAPTEIAELATP